MSTHRVESAWALLNRSYIGIYHWMNPKHLHWCCEEVEARINERTSLSRVAVGLIGKGLR